MSNKTVISDCHKPEFDNQKKWNSISKSSSSSTGFSVDQMIEAYETGLHDGLAITRGFKNKIKDNINLVKEAGECFFESINRDQESCFSIFLKLERMDSFELIYALKEDLYSKDEDVRPIYQQSWDIEKRLEANDVKLNIHFIPFSKNINVKRLISDGYICFYGELQES